MVINRRLGVVRQHTPVDPVLDMLGARLHQDRADWSISGSTVLDVDGLSMDAVLADVVKASISLGRHVASPRLDAISPDRRAVNAASSAISRRASATVIDCGFSAPRACDRRLQPHTGQILTRPCAEHLVNVAMLYRDPASSDKPQPVDACR